MPCSSACAITERIFVPNTPAATARSSNSSSPEMGFMTCVPFDSSASPLSTLRKGTTPFCFQRYSADPSPSISRSIVFSNRIAPSTRSPLKLGLLMIRVRISCMRSNISCSLEYWLSSTPYRPNAFGVLPPLWSRAAMKPLSFLTCSSISVMSRNLVADGDRRFPRVGLERICVAVVGDVVDPVAEPVEEALLHEELIDEPRHEHDERKHQRHLEPAHEPVCVLRYQGRNRTRDRSRPGLEVLRRALGLGASCQPNLFDDGRCLGWHMRGVAELRR